MSEEARDPKPIELRVETIEEAKETRRKVDEVLAKTSKKRKARPEGEV